MASKEKDRGSASAAVVHFESRPPRAALPSWYPDLLDTVSSRVSEGRPRAVAAANQELVATYWAIGHELLVRESFEGWGSKALTRLSADRRDRLPDSRGFSPRNLRYMKSFAAARPDLAMLQTPSATLPLSHQVLLPEKTRNRPPSPPTFAWSAELAGGLPTIDELEAKLGATIAEQPGEKRI